MCIYVRSNCIPHLHNAFYNGVAFYFEDCFQKFCPHDSAMSIPSQGRPHWTLHQRHLLSFFGHPRWGVDKEL